MISNIYNVDGEIDKEKEIFIKLFDSNNCRVEKIISTGQSTLNSEWLEEGEDEWVILLQGESELKFYSGEKYRLSKGDYLLIPSGTRHRVEYTSTNPPCIWLALHLK